MRLLSLCVGGAYGGDREEKTFKGCIIFPTVIVRAYGFMYLNYWMSYHKYILGDMNPMRSGQFGILVLHNYCKIFILK